MGKPIFNHDDTIDFIVEKTTYPRDVVARLIKIPVPSYWTEILKTVSDTFDQPGALELYELISDEREKFAKSLSFEQLKQADGLAEYVERIKHKGKVPTETAEIFAAAMLDWHKHVENLMINKLRKGTK
jgi:hypothetical protein